MAVGAGLVAASLPAQDAGAAGAPEGAAVQTAPARAVGCDRAAVAAAWACERRAQADYFRAFGLCANTGDAARWDACVRTADQDLGSARGACKGEKWARAEACRALGQAPYDPPIRPSDFVGEVTHPYLPLRPGTVFVHEGERVVSTVTVLDKTVTILGVRCVVVRDTEVVDGELAEDEFDYYAQDQAGNVWYFGEVSLRFDGGAVVSTERSWVAGVGGAKPGIVMPASPEPGATYRQEFAPGRAEDMARVESLGQPQGAFSNVLMMFVFTPLEPDDRERKYYAPGVGQVLAVDLRTGERERLVRVERVR
jgi:hypothetical protein